MPWFKVDDGLHCHPKAFRAGNAALGLWTRCGSWAAHQLTDGFVPVEIVKTYGTTGQAKALVSAGLWTQANGGYQFHEWNAPGRNPSRSDVEAMREAKREAGKKGGRASGKSRAEPKQKPSNSEATAKHGGSEVPNTNPIQSNPVTEPSVLPATIDESRTVNQRSKRLTDAYAAIEPMCKWPAVNGIIKKAIEANRWTDQDIYDALERLAKESRSVTIDSLRTELNGFTPQRANGNAAGFSALIQKFQTERIGGAQ